MFSHGVAVCKLDVPHHFPHGSILVGEKYAITSWLIDDEVYGTHLCIILPNPEYPGFFMYDMDYATFTKYFDRIEGD